MLKFGKEFPFSGWRSIYIGSQITNRSRAHIDEIMEEPTDLQVENL